MALRQKAMASAGAAVAAASGAESETPAMATVRSAMSTGTPPWRRPPSPGTSGVALRAGVRAARAVGTPPG
ncbi:hypothetical protein SMALB_6221 [Streptomyces malaysiensis]|uniref:Secreted protein n=2 Tax=Streptomyces malaysiensis TaxID=92644 RepID=A0A7X6AZ74_STRMQ|nr:hypothetical protein [Streptomyces malaysiensis]